MEFRGKRGDHLALAPPPLGRPAHHRLCPRALGRAEELGPVHQGLHDVRNAAATDQPDQPQLELLRQPMTMLDRADAHQSDSRPRRAAIPRSRRCSAAPTAAATVISNRLSSDRPALRKAAMSSSVTLYAWCATFS